MIEIKIDENALVEEMLNSSKEIIKKEVKNEILEFNFWDTEELESEVVEFYKKLIDEILEENKEELKKEVKEMIMETARDVAFETFENFLK